VVLGIVTAVTGKYLAEPDCASFSNAVSAYPLVGCLHLCFIGTFSQCAGQFTHIDVKPLCRLVMSFLAGSVSTGAMEVFLVSAALSAPWRCIC